MEVKKFFTYNMNLPVQMVSKWSRNYSYTSTWLL